MANRPVVPYAGARRPYDPLTLFHSEVDRLFDDMFSAALSPISGPVGGALSVPRVDVREDANEVCITADLPGVRPADVDVRVDGDVLTISGESRKDAERDESGYHVMERSRGSFRRSLRLPFAPDMDDVRAESSHGVLTVHVPRRAQERQVNRRIEVKEAPQDSATKSPGASAAGKPASPAQDESTRH
jgi:HSP20 family protein